MVTRVPSESVVDPAGLLAHLAARLFEAPAGLWPRVARARAIVLGSVARAEVIPHQPSAGFLADSALAALAPDGPGGRRLFVDVVGVAVERWLLGRGGAEATGVWLSPETMTSLSVTLPLPGSRGLVLLEDHAPTPLGHELARSVAGCLALAPVDPVVVPDPDGTVAAAIADSGAAPAELLRLAAGAHGAALQVLLGAVQRAGADADKDDARRALSRRLLDQPGGTDALLIRATLWRLGAHAAALADLDTAKIPPATLQQLEIMEVEGGGLWVPRADLLVAW